MDLVDRLACHLAALRLDLSRFNKHRIAGWPPLKHWLLGDLDELPIETVEPEPERDKIISLEEADDLVSWALDHWMFCRDLEITPPPGQGYPGFIQTLQDRIVSTDGLEAGVRGAFSMYVVPHGRSLLMEGMDSKRHVDRGKLKLMRYIVVLSLPEPDAIAIDGRIMSVHARTVFRYAVEKDLITKPVKSQAKPLALLSFLIHVPEEAIEG